MKKTLPAALLAALLLLTSCGARPAGRADGALRVVATTYPVYLLATALTEGVAGVEVSLMLSQPTSCLHDYTLTVADMKALDRADIIVLSGAGLEDFMADALTQSKARVIDSSAGVALLPYDGHDHDGDDDHDDDHDHDHGDFDPHYWMDPNRMAQMAQNIAEGLGAVVDSPRKLQVNLDGIARQLGDFSGRLGDFPALSNRELITFHDGFRYLADYLGLDILKAIEEEPGSEASAKEIVEITALIKEHGIPAIFTEINGSDATARAVQRETGVEIYPLDLVMSGNKGLEDYLDRQAYNAKTILEALG